MKLTIQLDGETEQELLDKLDQIRAWLTPDYWGTGINFYAELIPNIEYPLHLKGEQLAIIKIDA